MRFTPKSRSKAPVISMTSMLDVIFLLLFYFAARSVQATWESDLKLTLPQAEHATTADWRPGELKINIDKAKPGLVTIEGRELTYEQLSATLKEIIPAETDQAVIIRADEGTTYKELIRVIDICRGAGAYNFSLATETPAPKDPKTP